MFADTLELALSQRRAGQFLGFTFSVRYDQFWSLESQHTNALPEFHACDYVQCLCDRRRFISYVSCGSGVHPGAESLMLYGLRLGAWNVSFAGDVRLPFLIERFLRHSYED